MNDLLAVVLPVFGLIALGYGGGRVRWLGAHTGEGLSDYVFALAVPALIFRTMAEANIPAVQPWGYWAAYFIGVAFVWTIGMTAARRLYGQDHTASVVAGFACGQSNTVLVGIPLILRAYGEAGAVPLFLLIAVHLPITMTAATILAEGRGGFQPLVLVRRLVLHPIVLSLAIGLAFRTTGLPLSGPPKVLIDMLAASAIPCALVAMGLGLHRTGLSEAGSQTVLIGVLKLVVHPAIVYVLAFHVFSMPAAWAGVAVLFAAMPSGIQAFLFAERYRAGIGLSASAVAATTAACVLTVLFWLWMLGIGR